ncbi:MAG: zinc-binding dehydrogenase [Armatimonadetes bacterium]|nr:zinc-binding dehydrogenase [Armatimonadota bacterium]
MKAIWLYGPRDARLVATEKPSRKPDEALIRVESCVLCGSDVHQWDGRRFHGPYPHDFGHETAGTVVDVGPAVRGLAVGDRVTWYLQHGSLAEYFAIRPAELAVGKLADHLSWEEGANLQLLCAVLRGVANGEPGPGRRALVLGCGAVGLSALQGALAMGAEEVVAADLIPFRRERALSLGASATVDPGRPGWHAGAGEFDLLYDCVDEDRSPQGDTLDLALGLVKPLGCCVVIGLSSELRRIDTSRIVNRGLRLIGAHHANMARCREIMALCCQWVADGTIRVADYVTHRFPIEETQQALELAASQAPGVLKVGIQVAADA